MTLPRRDALKYLFSAPALGALMAAATQPKVSADGLQLTAANVMDYGATGDGTTDDTAAIHLTREAAGVGGRVIIPPGTYIVSGLTASVAYQMWELSDDAVVKMQVGAARILSITGLGVSVVGGIFDGANGKVRDNWSQNGIEVAADGVTIRNATVQNSPVFGICAFNRNRLSISGCTLINNYLGGIFIQNSLAGPSDLYDISITHNLVKSSSGQDASGIAVRGESTIQRVNRVVISSNTVTLPYNQSGETGGIAVTNGVDWTVGNNIVTGGFLGITCPNPRKATISDNRVRGFSEVGIEIPGAVDGVTITRNFVDPDGTSAGSGIQASAGEVNDVRIVGNTIQNFLADGYLISFSSGSVSRQITINGNVLKSVVGSGQFCGVYFNGGITGLAMWGNIVDGSSRPRSTGVTFLKSVLGASVNGNQFVNLAGAAVLLAAGGAGDTLDYINVVGNSVVNCGAKLKDSTGKRAVVGTNIFT
jgi:hypothetical protein